MNMRNLLCFFFVLFFLFSNAQGEANIWYFGHYAGLDFNGGSPVALTDGQINTQEGCGVISNANGELLFYSDGITVFNRLHEIMPNGTGLLGHPSSTQSATMVRKPGSDHLYYIFTTSTNNPPNGFRYTVVDMNLDNGFGAVTSEKNVLVELATTEHLGLTKHANGVDYWVIVHGKHNNHFYSYLLTAEGLSTTPVLTALGPIITIIGSQFFEAGSIRVSPSGSKLAFTSVINYAQLYDFDNATGVLSNELTLLQESNELISAAFSPDESVLYITNTLPSRIHQFNLNATDIPASKITIHTGNRPGQMQLGPDNKIYVAILGGYYLGVINSPNTVGMGCNFVLDGVYLGGRRSILGLPSFNQSIFFTPSISLNSHCVEEPSVFSFTTNQTVLSATWDFGDGNTSNSINPQHTYANAGVYNVSVNVVTPFGTGYNTAQIHIYPKPEIVHEVAILKQCDDDNDGFSAFNLSEGNSLLVANTEGLSFSYFETLQDAQNNTNPISNYTAYVNANVSTDQVFVRVTSPQGCFNLATLQLVVSTTLIPASFHRTFTACDDVLSGSNQDGLAVFDFSSVTPDVLAFYPQGQQLLVTYYTQLADALAEQNAISDISNHTNTASPHVQNIYVRVDSLLDNECLGLGHHITLQVERTPVIQPLVITSCDDDQDGLFGFDTSQIQSQLLNGLTEVSLHFYDSEGNAVTLSNPFVSHSQVLTVEAKNTFGEQCAYVSTLEFIVSELPIAYPLPLALTSVCDDEENPVQQNGLYAFDTSTFQTIILGNQTNRIVEYYDQSGHQLPSPLPNPFVSGTQNILVKVINTVNNHCQATMTIPLEVRPLPSIALFDDALVCSDNPSFTIVLNAGLLNQNQVNLHSYQWYFNGSILANQTSYQLTVNFPGVYTVEVSHPNACSRIRTITVTASNVATIENVAVTDLSNENTIAVVASGLGNYVYSLDGVQYQNSNFFANVAPGLYTVYVKDTNGCGVSSQEVSVLSIPKFFTPNADGFNDVWYIIGMSRNTKLSLKIYDRYGKVLKEINHFSEGWDGTYNGIPMPATDYWYSVEFEGGRVVKGHFSLVR